MKLSYNFQGEPECPKIHPASLNENPCVTCSRGNSALGLPMCEADFLGQNPTLTLISLESIDNLPKISVPVSYKMIMPHVIFMRI